MTGDVTDAGATDFGDVVDRRTLGKIAAGFVVAVALVYLLGVAVGWEQTLSRLRNAELRWQASVERQAAPSHRSSAFRSRDSVCSHPTATPRR